MLPAQLFPFEINDVQLGPFVLVPEVTPDLRFNFTMFAVSTGPAGTVGRVLNGISDAASAVLSAVYPQSSSGWAAGNDLTHKLNDVSLADCDGPTVTDALIIPNITRENVPTATLAYRTLAGDGVLVLVREYDAEFTSPGSCGKAPYYTVTSSIRRTSLKSSE